MLNKILFIISVCSLCQHTLSAADAVTVNQNGNTTINNDLKVNGELEISTGTAINKISTDDTLSGNSDDTIATEKAVKSYVDSKQTAYVYVEARLDSNQSVTSGQTNISYSDEIHDDDDLWNGTVFEAPSTGIYGITATSYVGAYDNEIKMYVNGVQKYNGNRSWVPTISVFQLLNQGDEVTFRINYSGTRTSPSLNELRIVKIR